jgi:hypothetical protein
MITAQHIESKEQSFKYFLFHNRRNRTILYLAGIAVIIQFAVFKYFYPFASYIHDDSFVYIKIAYYNLNIDKYMVGYPRFLRLFSVFSTSDTALVGFTYLLIQSSSIFLLFTLFYFYRPGSLIQKILLVFMVFNPLYLYIANLVSSDGLFLALSLGWFTLLIWTVHRPSKQIIIAHAILLFIAFTVRYNALIYPFISAVAFWLACFQLRWKIIGLGMGVVLCGLFVVYTSYKFNRLTGQWQYSPFSGWQLANNAMYSYRYVDSAERKPVPKKFQTLDNMIRKYFDSSRDVKKHPQEAAIASTIYMWTPSLPLWKYQDSVFAKDTITKDFKKWASMGPFFKEYGLHIITKYPGQFLQHFIWPNAQKYYAPPVEYLGKYNNGFNTTQRIAKAWFNYRDTKMYTRIKSNENLILNYYPALSAFTNAVMLCGLVCYVVLQGWKQKGNFRIGVLLAGIVWLLNAGFTILASSAALRFQSFPLMLTTIFSLFLLEWLWSIAFTKENLKNEVVNTQAVLPNKAMA